MILGAVIQPDFDLAFFFVKRDHLWKAKGQERDFEQAEAIDKSGEFHLVSERLSCQYNRTVLDGDEIVISLVGSIGIVAKVPLELRGANVHRNLGVIKLKDTSIAEFITSYMQLPHFMTILDRVTKGGVHKLLNLSDLREVEIPVPPIDLVGKFTELKFNVSHLKLLNETFRKEMAFESLSQKAFSGQL